MCVICLCMYCMCVCNMFAYVFNVSFPYLSGPMSNSPGFSNGFVCPYSDVIPVLYFMLIGHIFGV